MKEISSLSRRGGLPLPLLVRLGAVFAVGLGIMTQSACIRQFSSSPVTYPTPKRPAESGPGSLWVDAGQTRWSLIRDTRALDVGDLVTVEVINNTQAEGQAQTETSRKSNIEADIQNFFGLETEIPRSITPLGGTVPPLIKSDSTSEFAGDASTKRTGKITSQLSCQVTEVYPNGNMRIFGTQGVSINNEQTILTVEGIIRPADVTPDNRVLSTQIADARIEYTGRGVVSDVQHPGIAMRAFAWVWPF